MKKDLLFILGRLKKIKRFRNVLNKPEYSILSLILFAFINICSVVSFAQTRYPVTANIQLVPPYSLYLSDYALPGSDKVITTLLLTDANEPFIHVKLKLTIEGVGIKIETKPEFQAPAIMLQGGIPERLTSSDLAAYFSPDNLIFQGYTKEQYQRNAALPEGIYKFSIQAYEANTGVTVSTKAITSAWLMLNDPPRILSPSCNSLVRILNPQNLVFQWLPMQMASPNSASNTEYHFKLVQILPAGRNPNDAMNSSIAIFEGVTNNTTMLYGLSEPYLIPGQQYAWRVQARDISGRDMFKNGGISEVCMFTYGEPCNSPLNVKATLQSSQRAAVSWDNRSGANSYIVRYREKGTTNWYENEASANSNAITGLSANKLYEYQVKSLCDPVESEYSKVDSFSTYTTKESVDNCGKQSETKTIDLNQPVLAKLSPNDVITVDGFSVRIVNASGGNGNFSGTGIAYIPFLNANLKMQFSNITVSQKYEVLKGKVVAVRTDMSRYYAMKPSPPLKNDICQEVQTNGNGTNNTNGKGNNGNSGSTQNAQESDAAKVIILNDNVKVKEGDTIKVNGKQVVVTKDTQIKEGDTVVVNGKTINVSKVENTTSGALASRMGVPFLKVIRKMIATDSLLAVQLYKQADSSYKMLEATVKSIEDKRKEFQFGSGNGETLTLDKAVNQESSVGLSDKLITKLSTNSSLSNYFTVSKKINKVGSDIDSLNSRIIFLNQSQEKQRLKVLQNELESSLENTNPTLAKDLMAGKEGEQLEKVIQESIENRIKAEVK